MKNHGLFFLTQFDSFQFEVCGDLVIVEFGEFLMAMFALESSALDGRLMKKAVCKVNSLPKTKICRLKIGRFAPKGKACLPTIHFQG